MSIMEEAYGYHQLEQVERQKKYQAVIEEDMNEKSKRLNEIMEKQQTGELDTSEIEYLIGLAAFSLKEQEQTAAEYLSHHFDRVNIRESHRKTEKAASLLAKGFSDLDSEINAIKTPMVFGKEPINKAKEAMDKSYSTLESKLEPILGGQEMELFRRS